MYEWLYAGLQVDVITASMPYGLPLDFTLLPQYLKDVDNSYKTAMIGKWHLGQYHQAYLPTFRGFESHYGYWNGNIDYYDHSSTIWVGCLLSVVFQHNYSDVVCSPGVIFNLSFSV